MASSNALGSPWPTVPDTLTIWCAGATLRGRACLTLDLRLPLLSRGPRGGAGEQILGVRLRWPPAWAVSLRGIRRRRGGADGDPTQGLQARRPRSLTTHGRELLVG